MKRYLAAHEDWTLAVVGIVLFGLVIFFLAWSITRISEPVATALTAGSQDAGKIQFNVGDLKTMNLRGVSVSH